MQSGKQIDIPVMTLWQMLEGTKRKRGNHMAIWFAGQTMTYDELHQASLHVMGALQRAGIGRGDRVAVMLPNCPQYVAIYYAVTGLGAAVVQVNPMSTAAELTFLLTDSGATLMFTFASLLPVVAAVREQSALKQVVGVRLTPTAPAATNAEPTAGPDAWYDEWLTQSHAGTPAANVDPNVTIAVLQYTGGTTGRPKGAMLTHTNLVANAYQTMDIVPGINVDDSVIVALPLFHVYAMTVCMNLPVLFGISMLIVPRFDPKEVVSLFERLHPTLFPGVPTMYVALSQVVQPGTTAFSSLRICNSGGAPMPKQVMTHFEELTGAAVLEGYGLSEASPVTHAQPSFAGRQVGTIGVAVANTDAKIVSVEDGVTECAAGSPGELVIRGPQVMFGYWNRTEETREALVDGWLHTGDIATMDEAGYVTIVDRKKDMIIASGYNVYPREVEEVLYQHPAVLEAAVIGVPDDYRGETVKAYVVLRPMQSLATEEITAWCREKLSAYKVPHAVEFRMELPKTAVGKILRRALREA